MISLIIVILAAFFNGVADSDMNMFQTSIFTTWGNFWNSLTSWKNQFKNGDRAQGPRFFGSTTFLDGFTDGWHLVKMLWLNGLILAILFYSPLTTYNWYFLDTHIHPLDFLIFNISWGIVFELTCKLCRKK